MDRSARHTGWTKLGAVPGTLEKEPSALWRTLLVLGSWPGVAGAALARRARAVSFREDGTLGVVAASPGLARELGIVSGLLVRRLSERTGQRILRLSITIAPGEFAQDRVSWRTAPPLEPGADAGPPPAAPDGASGSGPAVAAGSGPGRGAGQDARPGGTTDPIRDRSTSRIVQTQGPASAPSSTVSGRENWLGRLERARDCYLAEAGRRGSAR